MDEEREKDPLLTSDKCAELCGIKAQTWRGYVRHGYAPAPDDPDADRAPNRRVLRWRRSTVLRFMRSRLGQGRRTDIAKKKQEPGKIRVQVPEERS
jgi:hypothetical protein